MMEQNQMKLKCSTHKRKASHLKVMQQSDILSYLMCDICITQLEKEKMISLKVVKESPDNLIIENWPLGLESQYFQFLNESLEVNFQKKLCDELDAFQENLIQEISQQVKNNIVKQFDLMKSQIPQNRFIEQYKILFSTEELTETVKQFEESKYEQFLNDFEKSRKDKLSEFLAQVEQLQKCQSLIQFDQMNRIKENLLKKISETDFFYQNEIVKKDQQEKRISETQKSITDYHETTVNGLLQMLEESKELQLIDLNNNQTLKYVTREQHRIKKFYDIDEVRSILHKYPVFDLCKEKKVYDILKEMEFTKSALYEGQQRMQIKNDYLNQIMIRQNISQYLGHNKGSNAYCISNLILDRDTKYVFRAEVNVNQGSSIVGLVSNRDKNRFKAFCEFLHCSFKLNENGEIYSDKKYGINKIIKGDMFKLSNENIAEIRVWLGGQILEVLDYPHYRYQIAVREESKRKLTTINDLSLFFSLSHDSSFKLIEAFTVDQFDV